MIPIKVEYLYGRKVTDVRKKAGGGYVMEFEDGAKLIVERTNDLPEHIEGCVFTMAAFYPDHITMHFNRMDQEPKKEDFIVEVSRAHTGVAAAGGDVHWPGKASEEPDPTPPDPSPERAAHGPSQPQEG